MNLPQSQYVLRAVEGQVSPYELTLVAGESTLKHACHPFPNDWILECIDVTTGNHEVHVNLRTNRFRTAHHGNYIFDPDGKTKPVSPEFLSVGVCTEI